MGVSLGLVEVLMTNPSGAPWTNCLPQCVGGLHCGDVPPAIACAIGTLSNSAGIET